MNERFLYWTPRILAIAAVLFMLLFSFDAFEGHESFSRKLAGFLIHSIPALLLAAMVSLAWFRELEGGILILVAALVACIYFRSFTVNKGSLIIFVPFIVTGGLFILHHLLCRMKK